ncbi:uncharacterized protein N7506_006947 [Penicillium brevicompactum]|uniref:uncharacterized protein n=1 Tax=Penicillium brevicompactum TaxID=5074 RepID=UPI002541342B|nr:uncharacterized protein N7506_006947 [Penicillium brevicompactum]KAJ5333164.1 hypothetical protein N7506_006947 [Penicillium brevicompactum]
MPQILRRVTAPFRGTSRLKTSTPLFLLFQWVVSDFSCADHHVTIIKTWNDATIVTYGPAAPKMGGTMGEQRPHEDFTPQSAQTEHPVEP